ncbi:HDOD domain-containing protein [Aquabacterium sp. A7-Y]|uniref:serine/threonine protein kinase n=1 Tax=Aquabacterium sp. A7-Y TaxID=1349605 RepID=UPI00223CAB42|nr:serine/threonine protein kinase [Aquabacterium sp. A7-Y]MCW7542123.1 HDOD domain-containing protein [Aquabacterium sp. A7-Y]
MAAPATLHPPTRTLGRYELRHALGQGAQSSVWRAFDPRLDREVALKLHRAQASDPQALAVWLREARAVSRLSHPHIVPLFEAEVHEQHPYLVFELVEGQTLSQRLREQGPLAPADAVKLLVGVLEGLAHAHEAGVVHRDLKPSNILIDGAGRARVMDFGIAASQRHGGADTSVVGTPGYIAPEVAHGRPATAQVDVYAAGLVLYEMLLGQPAVHERDPYRAIYRNAHEDIVLPAQLQQAVDDGLRAIVHRATARDTGVRYPGARDMLAALRAWLTPASEAEVQDGGRNGTLDFLLRRMRHKSDFPALSDSVGRIQRIANSEHESLASLANEVLKDVALTHKLLRLVNSAHFRTAGGGSISTVSRAAALIGFAGIRNLALSLILLEHMQDKSHASVLKEEFLRAMMAGTVAQELASGSRDAEESFIAALFQNLGRMLTQFYFPEEAEQIRRLLEPQGPGDAPGEESAALSVLGIGFQELGIGVARTWGLPETLQRCMRKLPGDTPLKKAEQSTDRLRLLACAGNDVADLLLNTSSAQQPAQLAQLALRYAGVLGLSAKDMQEAVRRSRERMAEAVPALQLSPKPGSRAARLLPPGAGRHDSDADSLSPHELDTLVQAHAQAQEAATASAAPPETGSADPAQTLAAGIQDISNTLVENFKLNEVLRMILETMYRAHGFQRVIFCLRDARSGVLTGRFGLGQDAERVAAQFKLQLGGASDLFAAVCTKGADTLISDASASNIAGRLPAWYRSGVNAPTFLLLPLVLRNAPLGLIYADKGRAGDIKVTERELSLLRTLRNQAVMAFKQAV